MIPVDPLPILWVDENESKEICFMYAGIQRRAFTPLPKHGFVHPGDYLPTAACSKARRIYSYAMRWGYLEEKDGASKYIPFAAQKKVQSEPIFLNGYINRRCAVAVNRFYVRSHGEYYRVTAKNEQQMYLAGIFRTRREEGIATQYVTVVMVPAPEEYRPYCDRLPYVLIRGECAAWVMTHVNNRYKTMTAQWKEPLVFEKVEDPSELEQLKCCKK